MEITLFKSPLYLLKSSSDKRVSSGGLPKRMLEDHYFEFLARVEFWPDVEVKEFQDHFIIVGKSILVDFARKLDHKLVNCAIIGTPPSNNFHDLISKGVIQLRNFESEKATYQQSREFPQLLFFDREISSKETVQILEVVSEKLSQFSPIIIKSSLIPPYALYFRIKCELGGRREIGIALSQIYHVIEENIGKIISINGSEHLL